MPSFITKILSSDSLEPVQDDGTLSHPMQVDKILVVNDQSQLSLLTPVVGDVPSHAAMDVHEGFVAHDTSEPTLSTTDATELRHDTAMPSNSPMDVNDVFYVHDASRETFASSDILEVLEPIHDNTRSSQPPMEVDKAVGIDNQQQLALCITNAEVPDGK